MKVEILKPTLSTAQRDALLRLARGAKTIQHPSTRIKLIGMRLVQQTSPRAPGATARREYELTEAGQRALAACGALT